MQILQTWFFFLLSSISLVSFIGPIHCATSLPRQVTVGYAGPAVYHIRNLLTGLYIELNGTTSGSLVNLQPESDSELQLWQIADVGKGEVILLSNYNGSLLSATDDGGLVKAYATTPSDPKVRWSIDTNIWKDRFADLFNSTAFRGSVLTNDPNTPATTLLVFPLNFFLSENQAWLLESK